MFTTVGGRIDWGGGSRMALKHLASLQGAIQSIIRRLLRPEIEKWRCRGKTHEFLDSATAARIQGPADHGTASPYKGGWEEYWMEVDGVKKRPEGAPWARRWPSDIAKKVHPSEGLAE